MPAKLRTLTLGCKVNQYETQLVSEALLAAGFSAAADDQPADLCVVNTCTVTNEGDAKSRQAIRRLARENPDARLIVMGCYAARAPGELARLPNVAEVVADKRELPDVLGRFGVADLPRGVSEFAARHRAYVKVQDGCLLRCSYCIIPYVRPRMTSRPVEHIVEEVARLRDNGYREIVLTGVHLGHYGVDQNARLPKHQWTRLSDLLRRVVALPGEFRVRLSSIEATELTRELLAVMAEHPRRVCPHLHICMQSGSDAVLRRMRRRWGARRFVDRCRLARQWLDEPALTTDVIVGFPGETEREFGETLAVARELEFSKIHVFPFSPRKGTPAAAWTDRASKAETADRRRRLEAVERESRRRYFSRLVGRRLELLVEQVATSGDGASLALGTACRYAPVRLVGASAQPGELIDATVAAADASGLVAR